MWQMVITSRWPPDNNHFYESALKKPSELETGKGLGLNRMLDAWKIAEIALQLAAATVCECRIPSMGSSLG
jgi:hypothetical protein